MATRKKSKRSFLQIFLLLFAATGEVNEVNGCTEVDEDSEEVSKEGLIIPQLDGHGESSDDVSDDDLKSDSSDEDFDTDEEEALDGDIGIEMEPPGSGDDVSDEEAVDLFDTENVVVCQYEKIARSRNRWRLNLKVGNYRMSLNSAM